MVNADPISLRLIHGALGVILPSASEIVEDRLLKKEKESGASGFSAIFCDCSPSIPHVFERHLGSPNPEKRLSFCVLPSGRGKTARSLSPKLSKRRRRVVDDKID